jgi:ribosomal protein S18 acetylase RimI-like enzyme
MAMSGILKIVPAEDGENLDHVRGLFREYADWIGVDLSLQNFDEELQNLPGEYVPPDGAILMAIYDGEIAGCVALHKISDDICEMKRLYVRPKFRGEGLGKILAMTIIEEARAADYQSMRLDTLPPMTSAIGLYESLGFQSIAPYRHSPLPGAKFMELKLDLGTDV